VTFDTRLTCSTRRPGEKEGSKIGRAWSPPQQRLPVRQERCTAVPAARSSIMNYASPIRSSASHSQIRKLQVLGSRCLDIATDAPWYVGSRQFHENLRISFFADPNNAKTQFRLIIS
jgi:hypothetical protein